jgi:elongator complex protein 3
MYQLLFDDQRFKPDEIKIYPCSLIDNTELQDSYDKKLWKPYNTTELTTVIAKNILDTPRYCRVSRVIRDIPSTEILDGNKVTNFRQLVDKHIKEFGMTSVDIREREIKNEDVNIEELQFKVTKYNTNISQEYFLEYVTSKDKLAGFLRLSVPIKPNFIAELVDSAIIREVHIYGKSVEIGKSMVGAAQHNGLGKNLINEAENISKTDNIKDLAVISSVGTREYYRKLGFKDKKGNLYQHKNIL